MKKAGLFFILLFLLFYYEQYEVVELSKFQSEEKQVEVKGAVKKPGVYTVKRHANVETILKASGGTLKSADTSGINLSLDVENHAVIVIPEKTVIQKISLNSATLDQLDGLPGIGPAIAKRIIAYRTTTPFTKLEDLKQVKGIGDKLYEKLEGLLCL